jgi:hypothetical protein
MSGRMQRRKWHLYESAPWFRACGPQAVKATPP